MSQAVVYIDHSEVREAKLDELKAGLKDLAHFVEANEPQILAYQARTSIRKGPRSVFCMFTPTPSPCCSTWTWRAPPLRRLPGWST